VQRIDTKLLLPVNGASSYLHQVYGQRVDYGLSTTLSHILLKVRHELGEIGQDNISGERRNQVISMVAEREGFELTRFERDKILAEIERDEKPFSVLQPLVDDQNISDIIVTEFSKVGVQQGRKNFLTDISFPNQEAYESFVERLLYRAGATFSTKKPIADGIIGSFARIHAMHRSLCDTGPYLTIRLNRFDSVDVSDLLKYELAPSPVLNYLSTIVRFGGTLLLVGEVGTGKTTLARALASEIPPEESILVIEDTPEIRLSHPHVRYITTREANTDGQGRISPSECIRAGMRMAMNRIIFGEIRSAEAAEAFIDVCASGHPGLSTIHARSAAEAVSRLQMFLGRAQQGVASKILTQQISTSVQVIVYLNVCKETGRRRIIEIKELAEVADGVLRNRDIFKYEVRGGEPKWRVVNKVSRYREWLEADEAGVVLSSLPAFIGM